MNRSVTSQISSVLDNIIQPEFALWLDDFLQERVGKYYWNDYVKKAFSSLEWQNYWDNLKDLDNWALCKVVFKCKDLFRNSDDFSIYNKIKDLYNLRNRSKHNTAANTSKISETDLYGLVDFLNKIDASQDSIEKIKKIIDSLRPSSSATKYMYIRKNISGTNSKINNFKKYLVEVAVKEKGSGHYSSNVADSYTSAINWGSEISNINLWDIDNYLEMQNIFSKLSHSQPGDKIEDKEMRKIYKEKDENSRKTLSNGLKRYIEFLAWQKNN